MTNWESRGEDPKHWRSHHGYAKAAHRAGGQVAGSGKPLQMREHNDLWSAGGIREGFTKMVLFMENLLREGLKLTDDMPDVQIEKAHRSLGPWPPGDAPPRSIVINFLSFKTKANHGRGRSSPGKEPT